MFAEGLSAPLLAALQRPDLRVLADLRHIGLDPEEKFPFRLRVVDGAIGIVLGAGACGSRRSLAFHLRHALERAILLDPPGRIDGSARPSLDTPTDEAGPTLSDTVAALAAFRVAALFWGLDGRGGEPDPCPFVPLMAAHACPDADALGAVAAFLGVPPPSAAAAAVLGAHWPTIGPVETLLATGGDGRLRADPDTLLNHYGTSHRPRPWAVTYASSTASALSERGFAAAERSRRRLLRGALGGAAASPGHPAPQAAEDELRAVRDAISRHYGLPPGTGIVLAASGTDCELVALAAIAAARRGRPLLNLLTAPDETGSGVPLASVGRHFADDTARGATVRRGALIDGMPVDIDRADLAVRAEDGTLLDPETVDRDAVRLVGDAVRGGRHVLLHYLDVSKTGLLAPSIECVARLGRTHRGAIDVVVDACQARLDAERVRSYVEVGWTVMVTGSKFFTGPPFCGAVLLPPSLMAALGASALPAGLADYCGRADWPDGAPAAFLPPEVNVGMVLRWQAAIGEMQAFAAVPGHRTREILERFTESVRAAIARGPDTRLVSAPPLRRPVLGDAKVAWDGLQTIIPFLVLGPDRRALDFPSARRLYGWLNADVRDALPSGLGATERFLAGLHCHVGQPAPVADGQGGIAGALRISAGARLVSGEPSHEGIDPEARLAREIADATACLEKLALLMRHYDRLRSIDPKPSFGAPPEF